MNYTPALQMSEDFLHLPSVSKSLQQKRISLTARDCSWRYESGTGTRNGRWPL